MSAVELLLQTARRGELHHAIILHGPSREVLRDVALRLAKTLNCSEGSAGDQCQTCQRIERRIHPDVHFIELSGERKLISVDQIREMVEEATLRPFEGRCKVFIIDPADAVSVSAYNATLKTLEEPSRDTTFILLTRSPDLLLPTIRSRSQSIYIGGETTRDPQLAGFIRDALVRWNRDADGAALLSVASAVAGSDEVSEAMALLGSILCEAAAGEIAEIVDGDTARFLAAADGVMAAQRGLIVNADSRLMIEQALSALVR